MAAKGSSRINRHNIVEEIFWCKNKQNSSRQFIENGYKKIKISCIDFTKNYKKMTYFSFENREIFTMEFLGFIKVMKCELKIEKSLSVPERIYSLYLWCLKAKWGYCSGETY